MTDETRTEGIPDRDPRTGEWLYPVTVTVTYTSVGGLPVTIRCRTWDGALAYLGSPEFTAIRHTVTTVSITSLEAS